MKPVTHERLCDQCNGTGLVRVGTGFESGKEWPINGTCKACGGLGKTTAPAQQEALSQQGSGKTACVKCIKCRRRCCGACGLLGGPRCSCGAPPWQTHCCPTAMPAYWLVWPWTHFVPRGPLPFVQDSAPDPTP